MSSLQAAGPGSGTTGSASPARLAGGQLIGSGLLDVVNAYTEPLSDPFVVVTRDGLYRVDITAWAGLNVGIGVALVLTGSLVVAARRGWRPSPARTSPS
ncbi:hypothetical protein ACL02O_02655 [Micromonospora sp. MS34]|uniref:DUF7144 family membrane protein n=1 Tax=Micromonospora sp. MS34 TaxID=3385971 RepID=UPI0039A159E8